MPESKSIIVDPRARVGDVFLVSDRSRLFKIVQTYKTDKGQILVSVERFIIEDSSRSEIDITLVDFLAMGLEKI